MEKVIDSPTRYYSMAIAVASFGFAFIVIAYGMDNIVMGAHDVFHDFRHVYGMPCH